MFLPLTLHFSATNMANFRHFLSKNLFNCYKTVRKSDEIRIKVGLIFFCRRSSFKSKEYDGNPDPGPVFLKKEVQNLLKTLTRPDLNKIYRSKKLGEKKLEDPVYKFMTDEELQEAISEARKKSESMLQMPPIMKVRRDSGKILSKDPALKGLDTSRFVFTDISFGVRDTERLIVVREIDGTLKEAECSLKDRLNQLYFPKPHRELKPPGMFFGSHFENILSRKEYEFILDRACCQFEPNDSEYQRVVTITYQHVNENNEFEKLRSTRHFGGLVFFLVWNKNIDNLLLDLIETSHMDEVKSLLNLYSIVNNTNFEASDHVELVKEYIKKFASKKGALELALQAYIDIVKQKEDLEKGIKAAHGLS